MTSRVHQVKEQGLYPYLQPIESKNGTHVTINGQKMLMFASYSYLGLIGHPKIDAAAKAGINEFGTGGHGARLLAGTTRLHQELEKKIAAFKDTEAAITFSSGYVTNLATISSLVGKGDVVICDKLNHASIVDGCLMSGANFVRFKHNDMASLEKRLSEANPKAGKLVVVDAVFSMDGDIINLPEVSRLCREHEALLMVDEAHSLGVLGKTGHGIEEHFGLQNAVDIKMGTLSKSIPSIGGYIAADANTITYLKHVARGFVFSATLPPPAVAAAKAAFEVIEQEPERMITLRRNIKHFLNGLKERGFNTLQSETAIIPIICGSDEKALMMAKLAQDKGIFVLPILPPAVPPKTSRLRATVTAAHSPDDINHALNVLTKSAKTCVVI